MKIGSFGNVRTGYKYPSIMRNSAKKKPHKNAVNASNVEFQKVSICTDSLEMTK